MATPPEISVKTVDHPGVDAISAYAKLRSYTPGRASFLLESRAPDRPEGRYSAVGYRVRSMEMSPPGVDAIGGQSSYEREQGPESLAAALALGGVGYISASCVNVRHRFGMCSDEGPASHFTVGAAVMVYDHVEGTVTVAGAVKGNQVERLLWELTNGPDVAPHRPLDAADDAWHAIPGDDKLNARAARARIYLEELESLVLSQTFATSLGEHDPFDAYRALRAASDASHSYYIDFGALPTAPDTKIAGVSSEMLYVRRPGGEGSLDQALGDALPHAAMVGAPALQATKLLTKLEENSRQQWGGAVGYICPGGAAAFVLADQFMVAQAGRLYHTVGVPLSGDVDPTTVASRARTAAQTMLDALTRPAD